MSVVVRPYGRKDYERVVELAVDPLGQERETAKSVISWASESKDADIFVAEVDDKIRGFVMMEYSAAERWAKIGYIGWIAVSRDFQRRGIGTQLVQAGEEKARKRGMRRLYVEPTIKDDYAICFYIMNGLMPEGRRMGYYPDGSDSIVLGKHL